MVHFYISNAPTGSGKTYVATDYGCERIPLSFKYAIVQPTKHLIKQSVRDAKQRFPDLKQKIRQIVSRHDDEKVATRITDYTKSRDETGDLLFITHQGLLRTQHWYRKHDWHLLIDEAIDVAYFRRFRLKYHAHELTSMFIANKINDQYSTLEAKDHSALTTALAQLPADEINESFADLISKLIAPDWNLYVENEHWAKFSSGEVGELQVNGLLHPNFFLQFASVTLLGANLTDSIMYQYFKYASATFTDHKAINSRLQYTTHTNGAHLTIKHLDVAKWSKKFRDRKISNPDEPGEQITIGDLYLLLCEQESKRHSPARAPMWIANRDIHDTEFDGIRLPNVPHGLNSLTDHTVCIVGSALNPPSAHRAFLSAMTGMTERQIRRAILSQTAYQACGRGNLRQQDNTRNFLLIVPDQDTAIDIATYYPGCKIELLVADLPPKQGRPPKYGTDEDRDAAKRDQTKERSRKYRVTKKSLLIAHMRDADDPGGSQQHTMSIVHDSARQAQDDLAAIAPQYNDVGGFAYSHWYSRNDAQGGGETIFATTTDFVTELRRRQSRVPPAKDHNTLFSPSIFSPEVYPSNARSIPNCLAVRGIILDIEHSDLSPHDFADLLPNVEMIVYPSYSHTLDDPRYRVCIPTTHYMTGLVSTVVRTMIKYRLEQTGYDDKTATRKHGIDTTKLNEASMFYWPCATADSFLYHFGANRKPLSPYEWVDECPFEVWMAAGAIEADPEHPVAPTINNTDTGYSDPLVNYCVNRWRQIGCTKGNGHSEFWFLGKGLHKAGMSRQDIYSTLQTESALAHNPKERQDEIAAIMLGFV